MAEVNEADSRLEWALQEAQRLADQATDYPQQAYFQVFQDFLRAQATRIEQAEGEIDGRSWNHEQW